MAYWDASALLKLYLHEADSPVYRALAAQSARPLSTSAIADTEILCAFLRKERAGDVPKGAIPALLSRVRADVSAGKVIAVAYGLEVQQEAERLLLAVARQKNVAILRSLDAIHIASAIYAKAAPLVSADGRMRAFAAARGMTVQP